MIIERNEYNISKISDKFILTIKNTDNTSTDTSTDIIFNDTIKVSNYYNSYFKEYGYCVDIKIGYRDNIGFRFHFTSADKSNDFKTQLMDDFKFLLKEDNQK